MKQMFKVFKTLCLLCLAIYFSLLLFLPFPDHLLVNFPNQQGQLILNHKGHLIDMKVGPNEQYCFPIEFEKMPEHLIDATLAAEDKRFLHHFGVDPLALCRAIWQNIFYGRRISGASTISMQVVKLLHQKPRTYSQKLVEMWHAILLEQRYNKREIMELYLNLAPYGGNLVGCESAARMYFQKPCHELSQAEAYLIAGLPQRPNHFFLLKHMDRALKRRQFILNRLLDLDKITLEEYNSIKTQEIHLSPPDRKFNHLKLSEHLAPIKQKQFQVVSNYN
jgi:penicillin-binding protein 1C